MKKLLIFLLVLLSFSPDADASRRRRRGLGSTQRVLTLADLSLIAETGEATGRARSAGTDIFDGLEASSAFSPSIPTGQGSYNGFPCKADGDNGDDVLGFMKGTGHFAVGSPIAMTFSADGRYFYRKRSTIPNLYRNGSWRAGGCSLWKFPVNSRWRGHLGLIFLISSDVADAPSRHLMFYRSADHGKTWSLVVDSVVETGTNFTAIGGIPVFPSDGSMLVPYYFSNCASGSGATCQGEHRYTFSIARSTDWETSNVPTFTTRYADVMRDDPDGAQTRQFEEGTLVVLADGRILAKARVDGDIGAFAGGSYPAECNIYQSISSDNGATWTSPYVAHRGCEKPVTIRSSWGPLLTVTRAYGGFDDANNPPRGQVCICRDPSATIPTWRCAVFQTTARNEYESAAVDECKDAPYSWCIAHSQERNTATPPAPLTYTRIYDLLAGGSAPSYYYSSHSWRTATNNKYISASGSNLAALNGATAASWEFWYRPEIDQGGTNAIMCRSETNQRQFCISDVSGATDRMQILIYASRLDAGATPYTWNGPQLYQPVGEWHRWGFYWSASAGLRITRDGVDITSLGTFTNSNIASLSTPTAGTFYVGANSATNFARDSRFDDLVIRASDCYSSQLGVGHWAYGVQTDPGLSSCAPIFLWRADNSFATDSRYASFTFTEGGSGSASTFLSEVPNSGGPTARLPHLSSGCGVQPVIAAGSDTSRTFYSVDGLTRTAQFVVTSSYTAGRPLDAVVIDYHGCSGTLTAQRDTNAPFRAAAGHNLLYIYPQGLENDTCNTTSGCGGGTAGWCQVTSNAVGAPGTDDRDVVFLDRLVTFTSTAFCMHTVSTGVDYSLGTGTDPYYPIVYLKGDSNGAFFVNNVRQQRRYVQKVAVGNFGRLAYDGPNYPVAFYGQFGLNDSIITVQHANWSPRFPLSNQLATNMGIGGGDGSVEPFLWDSGLAWDAGSRISGCTGVATISDGGNPSVNADGGVGGCCHWIGDGIDGGRPFSACWDIQTNHTFYPLWYDNVWRFFGLYQSNGERGDAGIVP